MLTFPSPMRIWKILKIIQGYKHPTIILNLRLSGTEEIIFWKNQEIEEIWWAKVSILLDGWGFTTLNLHISGLNIAFDKIAKPRIIYWTVAISLEGQNILVDIRR